MAGDQGVAVRRRLRRTQRPGGPAGADDILDQEFLAEMPRENIGDDPARDVGRPAGGETDHDADRLDRIIGLGVGRIERRRRHRDKPSHGRNATGRRGAAERPKQLTLCLH
jgi:hypothetical protein